MPAALLTCPACRKVGAPRLLGGGAMACTACGQRIESTGTLPVAPGHSTPLMARLPMWSAQFRAHYELVRPLGKGAMGVVYLMRQLKLGRLVAVKVVSDESEDGPGTAGLVKEAQFMASLNHPNIVAIYDVGTDSDKAYMVCEFVEGEALDQRIKHPPPMTPALILGTTVQILDGLAAAHAKGIVHRDLKPANVFLTKEGQAKIGDFGLAKAQLAPSQTGAGLLTGTPPYMSPEQCRGRPATPQSDLYSLGVMLFELCTGQRPFPGPYLPDYVQQHTLQRPPSPRGLKPELPAVLETIILRALEKDPGRRFENAQAMRTPVQALLDGVLHPRRPGTASGAAPAAPAVPRASGLEVRLAPGVRLSGRYELVRVVGQGGMGQVWLAHDQAMDGAQVAIKMLPPELGRDPEARTNLKSEARLSQRLAHPNVVRLFTLEPGDPPYLVMEFVDGPPLGELLAQRREAGQGGLSPQECVPLLEDVAAALDHSHEQNLIHRDVKPSNVLLEARAGKATRAKLGDFGIAAELTTFRSKQTGGMKPGTLAYMSPEQVACQRMDARADVYSLAATLYNMLTLSPPFTGGDVAWAIQNAPVPRPPGLPDSVWAVLESGLAKSPDDRPATCGALARALRLAVEGPSDSVGVQRSLAAGAGPVPAGAGASVAGGPGTAGPAAGASERSEAVTEPLHPAPPPSPDDVPMVRIEACRVSCGSDDGGANEQPVHSVELSAFEIDIHPVTNRQFARFVAQTGYRTLAEREGKGFGFDGFEIVWVEGVNWRHPTYPEDSVEAEPDHPVVQVAWEDAVAYCVWAGKRLPTEAQWECAARGGLFDARYPWGNAPPAGRCHFDQALTKRLVPVKSFAANDLGLYDCAGNVWQWCADTYHDHYYKACPPKDPLCNLDSPMRVIRGGALVSMAYDLRCARRMGMNATGRNWYTGFRAARSAR